MRLTRWVRARLERRALILLYHRVADLDADPWGLAVSPPHFEEQLLAIRDRATVIPLSALVRHLLEGTVPRRALVVTFDDGYADNLLAARPALERHSIPATVFVTTGPLDDRREFWWDELEAHLLSSGQLPPTLELEIAGERHRWSLGAARSYTAEERRRHRAWRAWEPTPTQRHAIYAELWGRLQPMRVADRRAVLDRLSAWSGRAAATRPSHRTLTSGELAELSAADLVDIGAHTVTHPRLAALSEVEQRMELAASRSRLAEITGTPVASLSYPFGAASDYTPSTVALARETGFTCACANVPGVVRATGDLFQLPRHFAPDVDGRRFATILDRWLESA